MKKIIIFIATILFFASAKSQIIYLSRYVRTNAGFLQVDTAMNGNWWTMATRIYVDNKPSGGGGGSNINVGSGFRVAIPNSNNIKTLFSDVTGGYDSTSNVNALTFKVDTTIISTRAYVDNLVPATLYTANASLQSDRTVDLNGHTLQFLDALTSSTGLKITNPNVNEYGLINDDGTGYPYVIFTSSSLHKLSLGAFDGVTDANIVVNANANSIIHTAAIHTFNGETDYNGNGKLLADRTVELNGKNYSINEGAIEYLTLDPVNFQTRLASGDGTASSNVLLHSNVIGNDVGFTMESSDGTRTVDINGNPQDSSIVYSSSRHIFNGSILYNSPASGSISDSILTWDATNKTVNARSPYAIVDTNRFILNQSAYRQVAKAKIDSIDVGYFRIRIDTSENYPLTGEGTAAYKYPFVVEAIDTQLTNTFNTPAVYTGYIKKTMRFPNPTRSQYHVGLHGGIRYEVADSINIYSTGGDFGASIQAENEYNELSSPGQVRLQGGTIAADAVPAIFGGHVVRTFTTGVHFRGYWGGFITYFNNGGVNRDTVDNWIAYMAPSTQAMKHYDTWTGMYITPPSSSVVTNAWGIYSPQSNARSLFAGQVGIGSTGFGTFTAPTFDASALLILNSTTQGFLPPVMNTTQMNAISSPATGLIIWNSDSLALCKYTGAVWLKAEGSASGGSSQWTTSGSNIYYNNPVGIGNTGPVASAELEVTSTTKGILIPRMTTTQQNAIASPASGLTIYNTDSARMAHYDGAAWNYENVGAGGSSITANQKTAAIGCTVDGQGGVVLTGSKGFVTIPYNCTITKWYVAADVSGSITFDVKRSGTSIIGGGNAPLLSSAQTGNATPSGWTSVAITAGDILEYVVSTATTITNCSLVLAVQK